MRLIALTVVGILAVQTWIFVVTDPTKRLQNNLIYDPPLGLILIASHRFVTQRQCRLSRRDVPVGIHTFIKIKMVCSGSCLPSAKYRVTIAFVCFSFYFCFQCSCFDPAWYTS